MKNIIGIICLLLSSQVVAQHLEKSSLLSVDERGKIHYSAYTEKGDILPDFSYCGYKGGGVSFPVAVNKIILYPDIHSTDDTQRIQQAIDSVASMKADKHGMRGAVLLKRGVYRLASSLFLKASGVVLRGEGCQENGTVLIATAPKQYTLIQVGSFKKLKKKSRSYSILDKYVPSGTTKIQVEQAYKFKPGDKVVVERIGNEAWIDFMGMNRIAPRWENISNLSIEKVEEYRRKGKLSADGKKYDATVQWQEVSKNIRFERTVNEVMGSNLIIDIPITTAFQKEYGGGVVYKYEYEDRPENIGIENLRAVSEYNKEITENLSYLKNYPADEKHGWTFLNMNTCENVWAKDLICDAFAFGYITKPGCKYATIQGCSFIDPVSLIEGGRRYGFCFGGQLGLVERCYSRNGRHDFVLAATVAGPNAFVECKSEYAHAASEPHQRWATGCLWDNCEVTGPMGYFSISNRGNYGTGHGWAGAQMVLWNCKADLVVLMSPPTAQNFAVGTCASQTEWATPEHLQILVERLNKVSGNNFQYHGLPVVGDGFIELQNKLAEPRSLYYKQLENRKEYKND
ncbi:pectate lyase [Bacteroides difficilis]|uniref:Pectate lyase n=1 Tax=Bacteroides difficilis TaxID=2763021 RepID=A0ABR7C8S1_9BACE|nr:pectate lyase [Bacteroides difficilis]MBC5603929.1 pectate lyase [Bacteroides difficilis]